MGCTTITVQGIEDPILQDYGLKTCYPTDTPECREPENCTIYIDEVKEIEGYMNICNPNDKDLEVDATMDIRLPNGTTVTKDLQTTFVMYAYACGYIYFDRVEVTEAGDYTIVDYTLGWK